MSDVVASVKRERWWTINEGVLVDALRQSGPGWEAAFVGLLHDASVEYVDRLSDEEDGAWVVRWCSVHGGTEMSGGVCYPAFVSGARTGCRLERVAMAAMCMSCGGAGKVREDHGSGLVEWLGCLDCRGTGLVALVEIRS